MDGLLRQAPPFCNVSQPRPSHRNMDEDIAVGDHDVVKAAFGDTLEHRQLVAPKSTPKIDTDMIDGVLAGHRLIGVDQLGNCAHGPSTRLSLLSLTLSSGDLTINAGEQIRCHGRLF